MVLLEGLGRIKETIKNLKRIKNDIKSIDIITKEDGLKDVIIRFKNGIVNWKITHVSEEGSNLFSSFIEKKIFFKRQ